jgi:hypothetical protein
MALQLAPAGLWHMAYSVWLKLCAIGHPIGLRGLGPEAADFCCGPKGQGVDLCSYDFCKIGSQEWIHDSHSTVETVMLEIFGD